MRITTIRIIIPVVGLSIGIIYYYLAPEETIWSPKCLWWLATGTNCPSCGIQRFLHLFLTGRIVDAFRINPFLLISLPYAVLAVVGKWYNINNVFAKLNQFLYSRIILMIYVVLFFAWWIIRILFDV